MPNSSFRDAVTEYSKFPVLMETVEACVEGRLDEAVDLAHTVQSELAEQLATIQDLYVVVLASQGLLGNALANAIKNFRTFSHLAIGYNRASELYMRTGQGLQATEVYEAGLKAIKKDDMTQRTILQTHRNELKLQYRDLITLLPYEISDQIFQEFDLTFVLNSCGMVSKAWLQRVIHARDISTLTLDRHFCIEPETAGRLLDYITTLEVYDSWMGWLERFFDEIEEGRVIDNLKTFRFFGYLNRRSAQTEMNSSQMIDSQETLARCLTKLPKSLTSLTIRSMNAWVSPLDFLLSCPNLTRLEYIGTMSTPLETKSIWTDKLTHLMITQKYGDANSTLPSKDLELIMPATPNVRYASIAYIHSGGLPLVQQHWTKLRRFYLNIPQTMPGESDVVEDEEYLHFHVEAGDLRELHEFLGQQKSRLRILEVTIGADCGKENPAQEFTSIEFDKLDYLYVGKIRKQEDLLDVVSELLLGAVEVKELNLFGVAIHPEAFEILKRMHQLERLVLRLGNLVGVDTYLDHLAALGPESPLKSIMFCDKTFDNQTMLRIARVPTLMHITIMHSVNKLENWERDEDASWTLDFLGVLEQSKSMVERISIPDYSVTTEAIQLLSKLAALRHLEIVEVKASNPEFDFTELLERNSNVDIDLRLTETADDLYFIGYFT